MKTILISLTAAFAAALAPAQQSMYVKGEEKQLIATIQSPDASQADKVLACKKLAVVGSKDAVPALAALLSDEKLGHMARYGLEPMPDPAAGTALRDAMGKLKGKLLVGVMNSIGVRRDTAAVGALAERLADSDAQVAAAAAGALGRIGNPASGKALENALAGPADRRAAIGEAAARCIEELTKAGSKDDAARLADATRKADLPGHIRLAATRGAILARGSAGVPLLVEQLKSPDWPPFALGLRVARELPGEDVTKALLPVLGELPADRQPAFTLALADRGDKTALPVITAAAKTGAPATRVAAIQALGKVGDGSSVPVLADAAGAEPKEVAEAAAAALVAIKGTGAEAALVALLANPAAAMKKIAMQASGARHMAAANPELRKLAADGDADLRAAAIAALGECATPADLAALTGILIKPLQPRDAGLADAALRSACARLPDKDAIAAQILAALPNAQGAAKSALLRLFGAAGGNKALDALRASLKDADPQVQDAALRALSEWSDPGAAPALLDLAKSLPDEKQRILALRGYVRLTESNSLSDEQKVAMCQQAMATAGRDDEKKMVLGALSGISTAASMAMILPLLDSASLKEEAGAAVIKIADQLSGNWWKKNDPKPIIEALEKVAASCQEKETIARANALLKKHGRKPKG